jgi:hypothetical protein
VEELKKEVSWTRTGCQYCTWVAKNTLRELDVQGVSKKNEIQI